ncbi:MAG: hypothetical protein ACU0BF_01845 [Paracoccaceae bacterium]
MADEPKTTQTPKSRRAPKAEAGDAAKPDATDRVEVQATDGTVQSVPTAEAAVPKDAGPKIRVRALGSRSRRRAGMRFDHVEGTVVAKASLTAENWEALRADPWLEVRDEPEPEDEGEAQ